MEVLDAEDTIALLGMDYLNELSTFGALSDEVIVNLLENGEIRRYAKGEFLARHDQIAADFQVLLSGRFAYYKHFDGRDVLTRHFSPGEQIGFDLMIGLLSHNVRVIGSDYNDLFEESFGARVLVGSMADEDTDYTGI